MCNCPFIRRAWQFLVQRLTATQFNISLYIHSVLNAMFDCVPDSVCHHAWRPASDTGVVCYCACATRCQRQEWARTVSNASCISSPDISGAITRIINLRHSASRTASYPGKRTLLTNINRDSRKWISINDLETYTGWRRASVVVGGASCPSIGRRR